MPKRSTRKKVSVSFGKKKRSSSSLVWFLILFILLPVIVWAVYQQTQLKSKAAQEVQKTTLNPQDTDRQTGEFYDLWISTQVNIVKREGSGSLYITNAMFEIGGPRVALFQSLYGFKQKSELPYAPDEIHFNFEDSLINRFSGSWFLDRSNCVDLHTDVNRTKESYIASFCYSNSIFKPNTSSGIYSPAANPFILTQYRGKETTVAQFVSTAFNKYVSKPKGYEDGPLMTRVNYLTIDTETSALDDFTNNQYIIQGITYRLSNEQVGTLCYTPINNPQKYFKFTPETKPEGGTNIEATSSEGACGFKLNIPSLKPFYISLDMEGGIPLPSPTPTPTPTPTPSPKPRPSPTQTPTPTPTPEPTPPPPQPNRTFRVETLLQNADGKQVPFPLVNARTIVRFTNANGNPQKPLICYQGNNDGQCPVAKYCMSNGSMTLPIKPGGLPCTAAAPGWYSTQWDKTVNVSGKTYELISPTNCDDSICTQEEKILISGKQLHQGIYRQLP